MRPSFGGWYYRIQSDSDTLAIIPVYHKNGNKQFCSIQIITKDQSWNVSFPYDELVLFKTFIQIGSNCFRENGLHLETESQNLSADGDLYFGKLTPVKYLNSTKNLILTYFFPLYYGIGRRKNKIDFSFTLNYN